MPVGEILTLALTQVTDNVTNATLTAFGKALSGVGLLPAQGALSTAP